MGIYHKSFDQGVIRRLLDAWILVAGVVLTWSVHGIRSTELCKLVYFRYCCEAVRSRTSDMNCCTTRTLSRYHRKKRGTMDKIQRMVLYCYLNTVRDVIVMPRN